MLGVQFDTLFRHARCLGGPDLDTLTDRQLLGRFAARRDGDAFARLVGRHGAMVFGICRRLLRDHHAAEDAFQAVFLVLARRAGSVGWRESAGGWLYEVAHRVVAKALCQAARRRRCEREAATMRSERISAAEGQDEVGLLHEELRRLPEKYRLPVVLCFLEGMSHVEAASQLGWPLGTVKGRLARARDLLKRRLARRGVVLTAPVLVTLLGRGAAAAPPAALAHSTTRAALAFASDHTPAALPEGSLALARDVLRTMRPAPFGLGAVLVLALGVLCGGAVLTARPASEPRPEVPPSSKKPPPDRPAVEKVVEDEPLPAGALQRLGSLRSFRPGGHLNQAAFSPDGKVLALAGRSLGLWDVATGRELRRLCEGRETECVAFSADGKRLLSGSHPAQMARLWDATTGKELRAFPHEAWVRCLAITADGKTIAVGCEDRIIYLWDADSGKKLATLKGHENVLSALTFAPDGRTLLSAGFDATSRLWEVSSGRELHRLKAPALEGYRGWVGGVAFSPDGKSVASANGDGIVRVWDAATGKERLALKGHTDAAVSVVFTPDGKRLISGSSDNTIRLWDGRTGKELRRIMGRDQKKGVSRIALSPDGETLASCGGTQTIRLWDVASGKERLHSRGHQAEVVQVRFAPDGRTLLSWGRDLTVRRWDLRTGTERCVAAGSNWWTYDDGIAFSPDRKLLAMTSRHATLGLWETETGRLLRELTGHKRMLTAIAFSPDGKMLASASIDKTIRIWDIATGKELKRWSVTHEEIRPLVFSPDGKLLAWAGEDSVIHLWSAESGKEVRRLEGHAFRPLFGYIERPTLIVFAPDSRTVLTSRRNDPVLRLWEVASGKELRQLQQPELAGSFIGLIAAAFSPTGRVVAISRLDGRIELWETATGKMLREFRGHREGVRSLVFTADGRRLASAGSDSLVFIRDVTGGVAAHPRQSPLKPGELDGLWKDLADADAVKAERAKWTLVAAAQQGIPFLRERLRPVATTDPQRLARLLSALDSARFAQREKAATELAGLGRAAEPALRRVLEGRPSIELRRRVERLLEGLGPSAPGQLDQLRGLEVLELAGTAEARQALRELARGAPEAWLTQEAERALQRMAAR